MGWRAHLALMVLLLALAGCSSQTSTETGEVTSSTLALSFVGNAADEGKQYHFTGRTSSTVQVNFVEPFLYTPTINLTNSVMSYTVSNESEWGFLLTLEGNGFWKDATFSIDGFKATNTKFCRDTDEGNNSFFGGVVYSHDGVLEDNCVGDAEYKYLRENYCDDATPLVEIVECEYNCYDDRGAAFCVNDENVKEPCDDQFPGTNFYVKEFTTLDGIRNYDYCISEIHGSRRQLAEVTCDGEELTEVNFFCEFGCLDGRCLQPSEAINPESLTINFYAIANSSQIDDWVTLRVLATDVNGISAAYLSEYNGSESKDLTWDSCADATTCNLTWRVARYTEGFRTFSVKLVNGLNATSFKNLTLNFSGDITPPFLEFNVSPFRNQVDNFTFFNISSFDSKGVEYVAVYRQVNEAEWELLESKECNQVLNCTLYYRMNSTIPGLVHYVMKSIDSNNNVAFEFAERFYESAITSLDTTPPFVNMTASEGNVTVGDPIVFFYETNDREIDRIEFYKQVEDEPLIYISSFDCGNNLTGCTDEFVYKNLDVGNITYILNVSDVAGNYGNFSLIVEYVPATDENKTEDEAPDVSFNVINVEEGQSNYTSVEFSAEDESRITYINLYELGEGTYVLLRTKFCFQQTTCEGTYQRSRLTKNTTFLVVAVDINGNRGQVEDSYEPG